MIDMFAHALQRACEKYLRVIALSICSCGNVEDKMEDVRSEVYGLPDLGFSLKKINGQLCFPCAAVCDLVGLSENASIARSGYSAAMAKIFNGVGIESPFMKSPGSKTTFVSAEAFLSLVFGGISSLRRCEGFDSKRLVELRNLFKCRIFPGKSFSLFKFACLMRDARCTRKIENYRQTS